jgi:thioredoxin-like negative regulator of GroEL
MNTRSLAIAVLCLSCALWAAARNDYYAVLVRSADPLDYLLLSGIEINGRDEVRELVRNGPLTEQQYKRLRRVSFSELRSVRVEDGPLKVQRRNGAGVLALPANHGDWPRTYTNPSTLIRQANVKGRILGTDQAFSSRLADGWALYVFSARPSKDDIAFVLAEQENTEEAWGRFLAQFPDSVHTAEVAQLLADVYLARVWKAVEDYQEALQIRKPGYDHLQTARSWLDKTIRFGVRSTGLAEAQRTVTGLEADINERLQRSSQLGDAGDFEKARKVLEPILHFRDEIPALRQQLDALTQQQAGQHLRRSRQELSRSQYDGAEAALEEAARYGETDEVLRLREKIKSQRAAQSRREEVRQALAGAQQAKAKGDYAAAFETLWPALDRYPQDESLRREFSLLRRNYTQALLDDAAHVEELHTPIRGPADEDAIINLQRQLDRVAEFETTPAVAVWRDRLRMTLADYYHSRSIEIADRNGSSPGPLAFAYLQQARHYVMDKSDLTEFDTWRDKVEGDLRIGLVVRVQDLTPGANAEYLVAELSTQVGASIQRAGFPHVDILDSARPSSSRPGLELVAEVLHAGIEDSGETESVVSEYSAGVRQAPNPKWREAKLNYDEAVSRYERVRARVENNSRKSGYSASQRRQDNAALREAQSSLERARKKLDGVSAYTEETDTRPYDFTRRHAKRTAVVRVAYRWVNRSTGVREEQQLFEGIESAEGMETTGVHPADTQGYRNQSAGLPEPSVLRGRALRKIEKKLSDRAVAYLKSYIGRDYERGQEEAARGHQEAAAEYYIRFLYNSLPEDERRQHAFNYLEEEFRFVAVREWLAAKSSY